MDKMLVDQEWVNVEIVKRKRKTVEIQIKSGSQVRVLAPESLSKKRIEAILNERMVWITEKIRLLRSRPPVAFKKDNLQFGDELLHFGQEKTLVFEKVLGSSLPKGTPFLSQGKLLLYRGTHMPDQDTLERELELFYRSEAKAYLDHRLGDFTSLLEVKVNQVRVKEQKHRWGSCSSLNNLNFNWRCAKMPPWIFDYVIAHEVCHLKHMNHSQEFWHLLMAVYPNTTAAKHWLKTQGRSLMGS